MGHLVNKQTKRCQLHAPSHVLFVANPTPFISSLSSLEQPYSPRCTCPSATVSDYYFDPSVKKKKASNPLYCKERTVSSTSITPHHLVGNHTTCEHNGHSPRSARSPPSPSKAASKPLPATRGRIRLESSRAVCAPPALAEEVSRSLLRRANSSSRSRRCIIQTRSNGVMCMP